ncbi:unnamed protein product [Polarella glacialis]|uniref:Uncharacterized protein n=1 Tax=Polarella glacialis TaxID=89957 RepID=A0A813JZB6_POLGL|nr:unnamed protein product [Polarella glacialis]
MTQPGCPDWGVRWLVYQTPISVSLSQLNYLTLKVSGFDSTRLNVSHDPNQKLYTESLPKSAVDTHDTCDPLKPWNYSDVSCWAYAYPRCDSGDLQSPIDINRSSIANVGKNKFLDVTSWKPVSRLRATLATACRSPTTRWATLLSADSTGSLSIIP